MKSKIGVVGSKKGLYLASISALIIMLVLAAATVYLQVPSTSGVISNSSQLGTTTTKYAGGSATQMSTITIGGCLASTFNEEKALGAMLNSSEVESYLRGAFAYDLGYAARESCTSWLPPIVEVNVTGFQSVAGNWSTQYHVTYSGNTLLRAEVSSSYQVINFTATRLPNRTQSASFTQQQQQVIALALSNSTVKNYLAGIDYFPASVFPPINSGNQTVANKYILYFDQVNGGLVVGVFVNSSITQVTGVYETHVCRLVGVNGNTCSS